MQKQKKIVFLVPCAIAGGIEKNNLRLMQQLATDTEVLMELVPLDTSTSDLLDLPTRSCLIELGIGKLEHRLKYLTRLIIRLIIYFQKSQPDIVVSRLPAANAFTVIAKILSGKKILLILAEHTLPLDRLIAVENEPNTPPKKLSILDKLMPEIMRYFYPMANCTVAVSSGIAKELKEQKKIKSDKIKVIYNPVVNKELFSESQKDPHHPWFEIHQPPVILAVGRLEKQKDYFTLIHAFHDLRQHQEVRLIILGEGSLRKPLEELAQKLELDDDICLAGAIDNPYAYMSHARLLVLSSIWEILPTVLIEALACGCPIVSTNCEHGPSEILENGKYGWLTPVGDSLALSQAMSVAISSNVDKDLLRRRGREFSAESSSAKYMKVMGL